MDYGNLSWRAGMLAAALGVAAAIATAPANGYADTGDTPSRPDSTSSKGAPSDSTPATVNAPATRTASAVEAVRNLPRLAKVDAATRPAKPAVAVTRHPELAITRSLRPHARTDPEPPTTEAGGGSTAPLTETNLATWVQTYVDPPWPRMIGQAFESLFNNPPTATAMQVAVMLGKDVASQAIPFNAYSSKGNAITFSVPDSTMPGGPSHGTVTVDNTAGTFIYTPDENFTGTDTFSFVASDTPRTHIVILDSLINTVLDFLGLRKGFRTTATVTVFNGVPIQPNPDEATYTDITGDFSLLTYDVSGPASGISNMLTIGSKLNRFDIVNVQNDTVLHQFLTAKASFPDQTQQPLIPNGLNTFSAYEIGGLTRVAWAGCTGFCIGSAGFSYSRIGIPGGETIDLYNLESTAGVQPTNADIAQLSTFIQQNSLGRAVIVGGDFGQLYSTGGQTLSEFAAANGLTDAWVQLEYQGVAPVDAPTCAYSSECEQPDKIFYRGATPLNLDDPASAPVQLIARSYTNEGLSFRTDSGQDLATTAPQAVTFGYRATAVGPANVDPENWMAQTPGISALPLTQLPIPGTHDSGSYSITADSDWALTGKSDFGPLTELPPLIEKLIVKPIAAAWGRTQGLSIAEQLACGIRYVDLRFSYEPDGQIYVEHGLRGTTADDVLAQIGAFAAAHPKELLVVDIGGLNNFGATANTMLVSKIDAAFGTRLAPRSMTTNATLEDLWAVDKNVIVLYGDSGTVNINPNLWPEGTLYQPWWNVSTMADLYQQDQSGRDNRPTSALWGLTGTPTPNVNNIVAGLLLIGPMSNYEFITPNQPIVRQWIRSNFKSSINVVTEDWFQEMGPTPSSYAREVISAVYETLGARHPQADFSSTQRAVSYPFAG
jgi:hypothetical protein